MLIHMAGLRPRARQGECWGADRRERRQLGVAGKADMLAAVRTVAAGGAVFSPAGADRLGTFFASLSALPGRDAFPTLTEREREVLDLIARGYDNRRIARELFLSDKTVRNHVANVLGKLGVDGRGEAAIQARNAGLGS